MRANIECKVITVQNKSNQDAWYCNGF